MRLTQPFLKLPLRFDADTLEREVRALPASAWVPHATGFPGNEAVRLVTVMGQPTDEFEGPMRPTEHLARCRYIIDVMAALGGVWGRSRLMGLGAGAEVPEHVDAHYHWRTHLRIHIPVITNPQVEFTCGGETVHMAPGDCWLFDSFRWHEVHNRGEERRVHLVLDTVVTLPLWDLIDAAQTGSAEERTVRPGDADPRSLRFEQVNAPAVMSPWEIRCHLAFIAENVETHPQLDSVMKRLDRFADGWAALWAQYGPSSQGIPEYRRLLGETRTEVERLGSGQIGLRNELQLSTMLDQLIFVMAVAQEPVVHSVMASQRFA
ncbi:MAG TPA: aspartyl/asparaginyl beta-hydroxylase domain-containing protein [Sphingomicrobium sp.]|nr:aspartyl/asparaginyl beta-hydroxylase domain-containing protein [Sphingomicrobium sp.]